MTQDDMKVHGMRCNIGFHPDMAQGYGRMGTLVAREMERLGVVNLGGIHSGPEHDPQAPAAYTNGEASELAPVALWFSTPPHVRGWYRGQTAAILTMWEGTEIPPGFRENLPSFDRVFVPCRQNVELYSRFHPDVRLIPLGVDAEKWVYTPRLGRERGFRFLTGGAGPRKNCAMVVRAFRAVFKHHPDVTLTIRARDADDFAGERIIPLTGTLSGPAERELYAQAHCFVSASRAEGWGLMPNQAIAQGLPTILPDAHGHAEFAQYGIPIDTHLVKANSVGTFYGDNGQWWEPDFDQLCDAMWDVYQHYGRYEFAAEHNAYACAGEFNWEMTAAKLIFNLPELFGDAPFSGRWFTPPQRLYHIRVLHRDAYTINGTQYVFAPGIDYYEPADLKLRLGEKGNLEPSVIDPHELGEVVARVATQRAQDAVCPTCNQRLNTNPVPLGV